MNQVLRELKRNPAIWISLIIFAGLMFSKGQLADVGGLKEGSIGIASSGKLLRIATVFIAGALALAIMGMRGAASIQTLFRGNVLLLTLYGLLAVATVVFSQLWTMTIFKAGEVIVVCLIAAVVLSNKNKTHTADVYLKAIFWIYTISLAASLLETTLIGTEHHKQLVQGGPLLRTMMQSSYPPMVGNALGFLGALVGLFGIYLFDLKKGKSNARKMFGIVVFVMGSIVLFLSYTRSILVFFLLAIMLWSLLEKHYGRLIILLFSVMLALGIPSVQDKIMEHMKRGSTDQQLESLSGRTDFWINIFSRDALQLVVGEGFATGTRLQSYDKSGKVFRSANAHNSVAEIVMSSGFLGVMIWLILIIRMLLQLFRRRRYLIYTRDRPALYFHHFIVVVFFLSMLRTLMNSTFVYVDYFFFLFVALVVYTESSASRRATLSHNPSPVSVVGA